MSTLNCYLNRFFLVISLLCYSSEYYATPGISFAQANKVLIDSNGKIVGGGQATYNDVNQIIVARYSAFGVFDNTFGNGGFVVTSVGSNSSCGSLALQADGKIIAAGFGEPSTTQFTLVRYNTDGTLDTSFNTTGIVSTLIGDGCAVNDVQVQVDGKIVAAGVAIISGQPQIALARYNTDGSLDSGFGSGGIVTTAIGSFALGTSVTIQADGQLVVAGMDGSQNIILVRYNSTDGSLDSSFGTSGIATISTGGSAGARAVAEDASGNLVAAGFSNTNFCVVRVNSSGTLDSGFGTGGIVITAIGANAQANGIVIQADNQIVVAGFSDNSFALARYNNTDGSLDTSFGTGGIVTTLIGETSGANSVALQSNQQIIAAGFSDNGFALARYNTDGSLDTSFGTAGIVTVPNSSQGPDIFGLTDANIADDAAIKYSKLDLTNSIVDTDINSSAGIEDTKLGTIQTPGKILNQATTATSLNTVNAIVARDAVGNFTATKIFATLQGSVQGSASANVLRAGDTMTGNLILPAGTATNPSLQFSGSTNTGLSAIGNALTLSTNGAGYLSIGSSGNVSLAAPLSGTGLTVNGGGANITGDVTASGNVSFNTAATLLNAVGSTQGPLVKVFSGTGTTDLSGNATVNYSAATFSNPPLIFTQVANGVVGTLSISSVTTTTASISNNSLLNTSFNYLAIGI